MEIIGEYELILCLFLGVIALWYLIIYPSKQEINQTNSILNNNNNIIIEGEDKSMGLKKEETQDIIVKDNNNKVLNPVNFKKFTLIDTFQTSHNTKLLRFQIPNNESLGLPVGRHISVMAHIDGNKVMRPYTPVSRPDQKEYFELLIKTYEFGKMSNYLSHLNVGDQLEVRGPIGRFKYTPNMYKNMIFICGGTGLTPCLQVIRWILEGPQHSEDHTNLILYYQNRTKSDILLLNTLETLEKQHHKRLHIHYYLSDPSNDWGIPHNHNHNHNNNNHHQNENENEIENENDEREIRVRKEYKGYIHEENLRQNNINPDKFEFVGLCGPSGFNEKIIQILESLGYERGNNIHVW